MVQIAPEYLLMIYIFVVRIFNVSYFHLLPMNAVFIVIEHLVIYQIIINFLIMWYLMYSRLNNLFTCQCNISHLSFKSTQLLIICSSTL